MAQDKKSISVDDQSDTTPLEKKIDAMMDPKAQSPEPIIPDATNEAVQPKPKDNLPTIDIFKDAKTAPKVSSELLKQIGIEGPYKPKSPPKPPKEEVVLPVTQPESQPQEEMTPEVSEDQPSSVDINDDEPYEDEQTDEAVDEITAEEGDKVLEAEDAAQKEEAILPAPKARRRLNLKAILKTKRFWAILVLLLVAVFGVPLTRYKAIGLVYKAPVQLTVLDSKTHSPVSNAEVNIHGATGKTDGNGVLKIKSKPGNDSLIVDKHYYSLYSQKQFVGLRGSNIKIEMTATGRQVPIMVMNSITGEPVKNAEIKVLKSTAKTDKNGQATIVLPASSDNQQAQITLTGFNSKKTDLVVTEKNDVKNHFTITPTGKVYFLSNLKGTLDVVKSDLDGTNRQTVVSGTGKEEPRFTSLLASRDWRYLVLKSKRDTPEASLYLLDTQTDKLTRFDTGAGDYQLVGWYGHNFIFNVTHSSVSYWQNGRQTLKSYNAERTELNQIDQSEAQGDASSYAYQNFDNFYILDNLVTYNVSWFNGGSSSTEFDLSTKKSSIRAATPTGQNKKDYQTFDAKDLGYFSAVLYEPQAIDYAAFSVSGKPAFYQFENGKVSESATLTKDSFTKDYPTYLISPNGKQAFWSDYRDGKNTLFTGSSDKIDNKKQIATLSDYSPYGWYSDDYLLVSKAGSELYITSEKVLESNKAPLKITDYYKPSKNFQGYGYGYGGL